MNRNREYELNMRQLQEIAKDDFQLSTKNVYISTSFNKYISELSMMQKRLIFYTFSQLSNDDRGASKFDLAEKKLMFKVKDFIKVLNLNNQGGRIYRVIEKEITELQSKPVTYIDEFEVRHRISWFSYTAYYDTKAIKNINDQKNINLEEEPFFVVRFTKEISQFLTSLENYVRYNFFISHFLKSIHAIRIYELLQSRKDTNTVYIKYDEFCDILNLTDTYRNSKSQMKKYVLEKAKNELNLKLNLGFEYEINRNRITIKAQKNDDDLFKEVFNMANFEQSKQEEKELVDKSNQLNFQSGFFAM